MITIYKRAADELDMAAFINSRGTPVRNFFTITLPVSLLLFGFVYLLWRSVWLASVVGVLLFTASVLSQIRFYREMKKRERMKNVPNAVEVFEVLTNDVIDIEAYGDTGPAYCFFVDTGKTLLVVGQWLMEYESFPADSFYLYRWSDTKKHIRIEVTGQPIDAQRSHVQLRPSHRFMDIQLLDAQPETLQSDLDRALNKNIA